MPDNLDAMIEEKDVQAKKATHCSTCGLPLWMAYLLMGRLWRKRIKPYREVENCTDLLEEGSL